MKLEPAAEGLLGQSRIGMLAIHGERLPLVNPAAFHYGWGSVWITTSRHAVKLALARRDPRAAFMVDAGGWALLLQGLLEAYDLRSISGQLRAALDGPRFLGGMAGYALKNAGFMGGYLLDLTTIPREWWPHNRVVLRLRPERARPTTSLSVPATLSGVLPGLPSGIGRSLARERTAYVCWYQAGWPVLAPGLWSSLGDEVAAWLPAGSFNPPAAPTLGAVGVVSHHRYRATRMVGACLRGRLSPLTEAAGEVGVRYRLDLEGGRALGLEPSRVTWWRGFEVETTVLVAPVRRPRLVAGGGTSPPVVEPDPSAEGKGA